MELKIVLLIRYTTQPMPVHFLPNFAHTLPSVIFIIRYYYIFKSATLCSLTLSNFKQCGLCFYLKIRQITLTTEKQNSFTKFRILTMLHKNIQRESVPCLDCLMSCLSCKRDPYLLNILLLFYSCTYHNVYATILDTLLLWLLLLNIGHFE